MLYLVIGVFIALIAWAVSRFLYLRWRGLVTTGTVVALVRTAEGDTGSFLPVVAFSTREGMRIEAKSAWGTPVSTFFRVGEEVSIRYLATRPTCFDIAGYGARTTALCVVVGGIIAFFCWHTAS